MTVRRIDELKGAFKNCARRGVRICVFAQEPSAWHSDAENKAQLEEAKQSLLSLGMHVTLRQNIHEKLAVIDDCVVWDGSLNILSYSNSLERMTRWLSRSKTQEVLARHQLDTCDTCSTHPGFCINVSDKSFELRQRQLLGCTIANSRKTLGLSQRQFANILGMNQGLLSNIESGKQDLRFSTQVRILKHLQITAPPAPLYMLPALIELLEQGSFRKK
jgi:hypothetical protein